MLGAKRGGAKTTSPRKIRRSLAKQLDTPKGVSLPWESVWIGVSGISGGGWGRLGDLGFGSSGVSPLLAGGRLLSREPRSSIALDTGNFPFGAKLGRGVVPSRVLIALGCVCRVVYFMHPGNGGLQKTPVTWEIQFPREWHLRNAISPTERGGKGTGMEPWLEASLVTSRRSTSVPKHRMRLCRSEFRAAGD